MHATSGMAARCLLVSRRDVETGQRGVLAGSTASTWGARALAASVRLSDAGGHPLSRVFLLRLSLKVAMNPLYLSESRSPSGCSSYGLIIKDCPV